MAFTTKLTLYWHDLLDLFYPNPCASCQSQLVGNEGVICTKCRANLPRTNSHLSPIKTLENKFVGKVPVRAVYSFLKFEKAGRVQRLLHQLKYRNRPEVGLTLGQLYGQELFESGIIQDLDLLVPVPLHERKKKQRGYNQSDLLAEGLSSTSKIAWSAEVLLRAKFTETQTHKTRLQRFENVSGIFEVMKPDLVHNKSIALIDDVLTTGSTLESAAATVLEAGAKEVIIITIAAAY